MAIDKKLFINLAKLSLKGVCLRVFLFLFSVLNFEDFTCISQQAIGEELGLTRQTINASIRTLLKEGLIIKGEPIGIQQTYKISKKVLETEKI